MKDIQVSNLRCTKLEPPCNEWHSDFEFKMHEVGAPRQWKTFRFRNHDVHRQLASVYGCSTSQTVISSQPAWKYKFCMKRCAEMIDSSLQLPEHSTNPADHWHLSRESQRYETSSLPCYSTFCHNCSYPSTQPVLLTIWSLYRSTSHHPCKEAKSCIFHSGWKTSAIQDGLFPEFDCPCNVSWKSQ